MYESEGGGFAIAATQLIEVICPRLHHLAPLQHSRRSVVRIAHLVPIPMSELHLDQFWIPSHLIERC